MQRHAGDRCSRCGQVRIGLAVDCACTATSSSGAIVWRLTGGRPMQYEGPAFFDDEEAQIVGYYRDRLGRLWMAYGPWSLFREPVGEPATPPAEEASRGDERHGDESEAAPSPARRTRYSLWP